MNKISLIITLCIIATVATLCITRAENPTSGRTYPHQGIVTEIKGDVVTFEDANGNLWSFFGSEDWQPGDIVSVMMYDNGTEKTIYDDQIIEARYNGHISEKIN